MSKDPRLTGDNPRTVSAKSSSKAHPPPVASQFYSETARDRSARIITFMTDFGLTDTYVGVMKGVVAGINPEARVIDLCHDVAPQDVHGAAFLLACSFKYFPPGTVHVAVIDPTVGTRRRALCVQSGQYCFVGPDNGVVSIACYQAGRPKIFVLENEEYFLQERSRTFHGRDIFAPVAAHVSAGVPVESLGRRVRSMNRIRFEAPTVTRGKRLKGRIVHVDRFGNLITNIDGDCIRRTFPRADSGDLIITCGAHSIRGLSECYGDASRGLAVALFGSYSVLEIAVRDGNASSSLGVGRGDTVKIEASDTRTV